MPKPETLKSNHDFRRAYHRGKSYQSPALVTYCNKNRAGIFRIGITASKKIGNAVQRNRARRIIMAAYAAIQPEIDALMKIRGNSKTGYDLVFVARTRTISVKSTDIEKAMRKHLQLAGLLRVENSR